ncbi:zinc finger protein 160-like [Dugong dugon]
MNIIPILKERTEPWTVVNKMDKANYPDVFSTSVIKELLPKEITNKRELFQKVMLERHENHGAEDFDFRSWQKLNASLTPLTQTGSCCEGRRNVQQGSRGRIQGWKVIHSQMQKRKRSWRKMHLQKCAHHGPKAKWP